jgi:hypothetical protein
MPLSALTPAPVRTTIFFFTFKSCFEIDEIIVYVLKILTPAYRQAGICLSASSLSEGEGRTILLVRVYNTFSGSIQNSLSKKPFNNF